MQNKFIKMDGLGNDFVIIDNRKSRLELSEEQVVELASRDNPQTGGCDQLIIIENSDKADCFMRIFNADGGQVDACGNASRCIGWLVGQELDKDNITIETLAGVLQAEIAGERLVAVNMGKARLDWQEIPLAQEMDTLHLPVEEGGLRDPVGVSMGNPHAVFFVDDTDAVDLSVAGVKIEHHPLFPERVNVGVAQVMPPDASGNAVIKLRVFERGAGETLACGTGACAATVAAIRRKLINGRKATVILKGGELQIEWLENGDVIMTGEVSGVLT